MISPKDDITSANQRIKHTSGTRVLMTSSAPAIRNRCVPILQSWVTKEQSLSQLTPQWEKKKVTLLSQINKNNKQTPPPKDKPYYARNLWRKTKWSLDVSRLSFPANEGLKCTNNNISESRCPWGGIEGRWVMANLVFSAWSNHQATDINKKSPGNEEFTFKGVSSKMKIHGEEGRLKEAKINCK